MSGPRILVLDIETAPNLAYVWKLWNIQHVSLSQVKEAGHAMCFGAKWLGDDQTLFWSEYEHSPAVMLEAAHELLDEADAVITYNGDRFDLPILNWEFLQLEMGPPSPYISLDLLKAVRKNFRAHSNKLDAIVQQLDIGSKTKHAGFELWIGCLNGDPDAWQEMETYNRQDVKLTEELALRLKPWLTKWPNPVLFEDEAGDQDDELRCPACGGRDVERRGFYYTRVGRYQRFKCLGCGRWATSGRRDRSVDLR